MVASPDSVGLLHSSDACMEDYQSEPQDHDQAKDIRGMSELREDVGSTVTGEGDKD